MNNFITADAHFNHPEIIEACNRPFKDVVDMNEKMVQKWNQRVKKDDTVYHLGDFCFKDKLFGPAQWEAQLNGKIVHIKGNHDYNNGLKAILTHALIEFAGKIILLQHEPPQHPGEVPSHVDYVFCGHVHELWRFRIEHFRSRPLVVLNVGMDQWNFMPMKLIEVIETAKSIERGI